MMKNRPEFPLTWLAIGKIGAIMVQINIFYKKFEAKYLLEHSEARIVVTTSDNIPLLTKIKASVKSIKKIISVDDSPDSEIANLIELCKEAPTDSPSIPLYPEDIINILEQRAGLRDVYLPIMIIGWKLQDLQ